MKFVLALALFAAASGSKVDANPLSKVVQLLDDLTAKIVKEGEAEAKAFHEYSEWCDEASHNAQFAIQTAESDKEKLTAKIGELTSDIQVAEAKIGELAAAIATAESQLTDAGAIRGKESADFAASESELMSSIDTLNRAIGLLEKEMAKNPAAFAQMDTSSMAGLVKAISVMLDAASVSSQDQSRLQSLLQAQQEGADEDASLGAPAAAVYKTHSTGILDVVEDLKEKAESQLSELRKTEGNTRHNYDMLRQSLEDQKASDTKHLGDEKAAKAAAEEAKATAEGDLQKTEAFLSSSQTELATTHAACLTTAADHEATVAGRDGELATLAKAKKVLLDTTAGAEGQSYSFLQLGSGSGSGLRLETREDLTRSEVITMVRNLARRHHSAALAQLAARIAAVARLGAAGGEDPFGKIKGLIQELIAKLESEADADATEKAYCDHELAKTEEKKSELEEDIAKLTAKIDEYAAMSAELKAQVQALSDELAALAKEQAELDKIRQETHADYVVAKADLELGLKGVREALSTLRDYYASGGAAAAAMLQDDAKFSAFMQQPAPPVKHGKSTGAGQSIIGILEVVESDFATNLAKEEAEEADAQSEYEKVSQENAVTKTMKDQDVAYKTAEAKSLDKSITELSADRASNSAELTAVLEYYAKIKERCIAKPETYEERKRRREAEIEGLKVALRTLQEETALVQRQLRGGHRRARRGGGALVAAAAATP